MSWHPPPSRLATLPAPICAWFRHVRILLPCPYAARRPVPIASTNAEVILGLSSPGMLMTDGCHWRHGATGSHTVRCQSAHAHQAPCCGPGPLVPFSLHAAVAGGLQPTSVSAPSSRAAARMSGGTDLGHRRRPGPRLARAAPVTPILLGFGRGTPGFHPEGCAGFNSRSSELKPAQPWELKPAAGIRTSTGTDADELQRRAHRRDGPIVLAVLACLGFGRGSERRGLGVTSSRSRYGVPEKNSRSEVNLRCNCGFNRLSSSK